MALAEVIVTKGPVVDAIQARLTSGETVSFAFPKKGPVPHDCIHLFVEEGLGLGRGFWGMVAEGLTPDTIQALAKSGGHASATRRRSPDASIVELIQAERLVECFEADLWGGPTDCETFRGVADAACAASLVPAIALSDETIAAIRQRIADFASEWTSSPVGAQMRFRLGETRS